MGSDVFLEYVNHYMDIVHQHPFRVLRPLNMPRLIFKGFAHQFLDRVYNSVYVGVGSSVAHDEVVAYGIVNLSEIKYADVLSF